MEKNRFFEIVAGIGVVAVSVAFLFFSYTHVYSPSVGGDSPYLLTAKFSRADGLLVGSDVRLSGVLIGRVTRMVLDPKTYLAVVSFEIPKNVKLPSDSVAEILGDGLMGQKFLSLSPGGSEKNLRAGDEVVYTQSSVSFESLIGQLIFSNQSDEKKSEQRNSHP